MAKIDAFFNLMLEQKASDQRVCMKGFSQFGVLAGDEAQGFGQVVFAHVGLKVGE
jgi:hypothetical protein